MNHEQYGLVEEVIDRAYVAMEYVDEFVKSHQGLFLNETNTAMKLVDDAHDKLFRAYQELGQVLVDHPPTEDE